MGLTASFEKFELVLELRAHGPLGSRADRQEAESLREPHVEVHVVERVDAARARGVRGQELLFVHEFHHLRPPRAELDGGQLPQV